MLTATSTCWRRARRPSTCSTGNGDGSFQAADRFDTTPRVGGALVAVGDFDGDGRPDLAVAAASGHQLSIYLNRTGAATALTFEDTCGNLIHLVQPAG